MSVRTSQRTLNCDLTGPLLHHKNSICANGKYSNVHVWINLFWAKCNTSFYQHNLPKHTRVFQKVKCVLVVDVTHICDKPITSVQITSRVQFCATPWKQLWSRGVGALPEGSTRSPKLKYGKSFYIKQLYITDLWLKRHLLTALALGNPKAKVPYTTLLPSQVKNFPADLKFAPPSSFGIQSLKRILDAADAIYFDCKCTYVSTREVWSLWFAR